MDYIYSILGLSIDEKPKEKYGKPDGFLVAVFFLSTIKFFNWAQVSVSWIRYCRATMIEPNRIIIRSGQTNIVKSSSTPNFRSGQAS